VVVGEFGVGDLGDVGGVGGGWRRPAALKSETGRAAEAAPPVNATIAAPPSTPRRLILVRLVVWSGSVNAKT
jgi:hypothetical protein